jgi:hypothetical protein
MGEVLMIDKLRSKKPKFMMRKGWTIALIGLCFSLCLGLSLGLAWIIQDWPIPRAADVTAVDLVGIWEAHYSINDGMDRLVLRADGTYQQVYYSQWKKYTYETPWNRWHLERFADGRARIYLEGARYYPQGVEVGELEGLEYYPPGWGNWPQIHGPEPYPHVFYDEQSDEFLTMVGQLILDVRPQFSSKGFVLVHLAYDADHFPDTFAWTGGGVGQDSNPAFAVQSR